jgi:predicted flap endonuclease-1-like 5' DNA nuclease
MYRSHDQAYERQRRMLDSAAEQRTALYAKRLSKAARRAERAERQLSRSWREAARRHAELHRITGYGPMS